MVGWSRRSAESSKRAREYREWFDSLSKEEQVDELVRQDRERMSDAEFARVMLGLSLLGLGLVLSFSYFVF